MKKIISVLLIFVLSLSICTVLSAEQSKTDAAFSAIKDSFSQTTDAFAIMDMAACKNLSAVSADAVSSAINENLKLARESTKMTDVAKAVLMLSAVGVNVTAAPGSEGESINLVSRLCGLQTGGINGAAFGLLALDSRAYTTPSGAAITREALTCYMLSLQHTDGGFSLSETLTSESDPDVTAMVISALAPYYTAKTDTYGVKSAVDSAVAFLSSVQQEDGTYKSYGVKNSNSSSAVITALSAIGINADTDTRFIKGTASALDGLLAFKTTDNFFGYNNNTTKNALATEQAFRAIIAFKGQNNIYDFSSLSEKAAQTKNITLRIEGISENLFCETEKITLSGQNLSVTDAIIKMVDEENYTREVSSWGSYFTEFFGDTASTFNKDYDGWQFRVNGKMVNYGMDSYLLSDGDVIDVFYGGSSIAYPAVSVYGYRLGDVALLVTADMVEYLPPTYDAVYKTVPVANATVTFYGANDDFTTTTNSSGIAVINKSYTEGGMHHVQVEKYDSEEVNGKFLPLVVRLPEDYTIELKNQVVLKDEESITLTSSDYPTIYFITSETKTTTFTSTKGSNYITMPQADFVLYESGISVLFKAGTKIYSSLAAWDKNISLPRKSASDISGYLCENGVLIGDGSLQKLSKPVEIRLPNTAKTFTSAYTVANNTATKIENEIKNAAEGASVSTNSIKVLYGKGTTCVFTKILPEIKILSDNDVLISEVSVTNSGVFFKGRAKSEKDISLYIAMGNSNRFEKAVCIPVSLTTESKGYTVPVSALSGYANRRIFFWEDLEPLGKF